MKTVVFTDLDGTLLDLENYSVGEASLAVEKLLQAGIYIVFCSSKTLAEQQVYLEKLHIRAPAIVENGSAISWPVDFQFEFPAHYGKTAKTGNYHHLVLGKEYSEVLQIIQKHASVFPFPLRYYGNSSVAEIMETTGLDYNGARRAMDRQFSETLFNVQPEGQPFRDFDRALNAAGFQCIPGSRYITITGIGNDKGSAVRAMTGAWETREGTIKSYGIGDSRNDLEMLEAVDMPYLVAKPDGNWADIQIQGLQKIPGIGPKGWKLVAEEILHATK